MTNEELSKACLIELFRRVGLDFSYEQAFDYAETKGDRWFWSRSWTKQEQDAFASWMDGYLRSNTKWDARKRKREIRMFLFAWGWKVAN